MRGQKAALRYAKSLLVLGIERNETEALLNEVNFILSTLNSEPQLQAMLKNPIIKQDVKHNILNEIFSTKIGELSMAFINIITKKQREAILKEILKAYIHLYNEYNHIVEANITTAIALSNEVKMQIVSLIEADSNKKIELTETIKPSIIGGFIVKVGDKQVDQSVSRQIATLKKEFKQNQYIAKF